MKGFLPEQQPSKKYSINNNSLNLLTDLASDLPKLLLTGQLQNKINRLKDNELEISELLINKKPSDINLAMRHLSFKNSLGGSWNFEQGSNRIGSTST